MNKKKLSREDIRKGLRGARTNLDDRTYGLFRALVFDGLTFQKQREETTGEASPGELRLPPPAPGSHAARAQAGLDDPSFAGRMEPKPVHVSDSKLDELITRRNEVKAQLAEEFGGLPVDEVEMEIDLRKKAGTLTETALMQAWLSLTSAIEEAGDPERYGD